MHDRLGSVRQIFDTDGNVVNYYFYDPWGKLDTAISNSTVTNIYRFAGYAEDAVLGQYHCNARQYDPILGVFTAIDPVRGGFKEPLTLHPYLYCINDPINNYDPDGRVITLAASLVIRAFIGGLVGSIISSAMSTEGDWKKKGLAAALGFVSGFLSGAISNPILGTVAGMILGGDSSAFNAYLSGGGMDEIKMNALIGMAGGAVGGIFGAQWASDDALVGLWSFTGATVAGGGYAFITGETYSGWLKIVDVWKKNFWGDLYNGQYYGPGE